MARIALFGGSFDPIHNGHLTIALSIKEAKNLDEVWVIPAHCSPFRDEGQLTAAHHRAQMVKLAIEDIPGFRMLDIELKRPAPSYTIETVKQLLQNNPEHSFSLILAEDLLADLPKWEGYEELLQLIPFLVGSRIGHALPPQLPSLVYEVVKEGYVQTPLVETSATMIRERLKKELYCGHLLPAKVLDYISLNQLYYNL